VNAPAPVTPTDLAALLGARVDGTPGHSPITGASLDSRTVGPGQLYCALPGARTHGARFADQAKDRGATLALTDEAGSGPCREAGLPALVVEDPRAATAPAAARIHGDPSRDLTMIGVTGTNGKTSITTMLHHTLGALGRSHGLIGTSGTTYRGPDGQDVAVPTVRTTPEAPEVQALLAGMVRAGVQGCAMEVSSHAMVMHRADAIDFDVCCFTGLTQDHLDFHPTMEDYFRAKASLFTPEHTRRAVICVDDDWGRRLAAEASVPVVTYTTDPTVTADARVTDIRADGYGSRFRLLRADGTSHVLRSALPGRHYVANAVAVLLLLEAVGVTGPQVREAIGDSGTVPGRMELVCEHPRAVVDFSHTEDALDKALSTLRALPDAGRVIAVIGAGGDRDAGKRPHMGAVAAHLADVVIITDDNPRSEDPASIRTQVRAGIPAATTADVHEVGDRSAAIALAVSLADVGDTILLAGKGAETGQQIGDTVLPFDDRQHLRAALTPAPHGGH
jgi:UDP-N-acetylmuramoyl-L-alanyl-D-glutamate--2,6-diaminopimelate ligase